MSPRRDARRACGSAAAWRHRRAARARACGKGTDRRERDGSSVRFRRARGQPARCKHRNCTRGFFFFVLGWPQHSTEARDIKRWPSVCWNQSPLPSIGDCQVPTSSAPAWVSRTNAAARWSHFLVCNTVNDTGCSSTFFFFRIRQYKGNTRNTHILASISTHTQL